MDLSYRGLKSLPRDFATRYPCLDQITLHSNKFSRFPEELTDIESMEDINIACNWLRTVPRSLLKMKKLEVLILNKNRIQKLPLFLCPLLHPHGNLKGIWITQNPCNKGNIGGKAMVAKIKRLYQIQQKLFAVSALQEKNLVDEILVFLY